MNVNDKYVNIEISACGYQLKHSPKKEASAKKTLLKIEQILKEQINPTGLSSDLYGNLSSDQEREILKEKAKFILDNYTSKVSKLNPIARRIFGQQKKLTKIYHRIENFTQKAALLPLPAELIQQIMQFMPAKDQLAIAKVNRLGVDHAEEIALQRAKELGYQGIDHGKATIYLKQLYHEVRTAHKDRFEAFNGTQKGLIPRHLRVYTKHGLRKTFNPFETLKKLQNLPAADLLPIFQHRDFYRPKFSQLRQFLMQATHEQITDPRVRESEDAKRSLSDAILSGNVETLSFLIAHGLDINTKPYYDHSLVSLAVRDNRIEALKWLIEQGSNPQTVNLSGDSPLYLSLMNGGRYYDHTKPSTQALEILLQSPAARDIDKVDGYRGSLLHYAVKFRKLEHIEILLKNGADINIQNSKGRTPLHEAVLSNDLEMVQFLLTHGARVIGSDNQGVTPLMHAPSREMTEILLKAPFGKSFINQTSKEDRGGSALHYAVRRGDLEQVKLLFENGANPNALTMRRVSPLQVAFGWNRDWKIIEELIKNGASLTHKDQSGQNVLFYAHTKEKLIKLLETDARQFINEEGDEGTVLHYRVANGNLKLLRILIKAGADVNAVNQEGVTPLILAKTLGKKGFVKELRSHGAVD